MARTRTVPFDIQDAYKLCISIRDLEVRAEVLDWGYDSAAESITLPKGRVFRAQERCLFFQNLQFFCACTAPAALYS